MLNSEAFSILDERLMSIDKWKAVTFCAVNSQRFYFFFSALNTSNSDVLYMDGINLIWDYLDGEFKKESYSKLLRILVNLPEIEIDNSRFGEYYAKESLGVLIMSLESIVENSNERASWVSEQAMGIMSSFDFILKNDHLTREDIDDSQNMPIEELESFEFKIGNEILDYLGEMKEFNINIREDIAELYNKYDNFLFNKLEEVKKISGWSCS